MFRYDFLKIQINAINASSRNYDRWPKLNNQIYFLAYFVYVNFFHVIYSVLVD